MGKLIFTFLILFMPLSNAQATTDGQLWFQSIVQGAIAPKFKFYFEIQPRLSHHISTLNSTLIRPAGIYLIDPQTSAWLGYAWVPLFTGTFHSEHRIWQQLLKEIHGERLDWMHRFRLEERFLPTSSLSFRFRYMIRSLYALEETKTWSIALWDELLLNLNSVVSGPQVGFNQNRLFAGISYFSGTYRIEPGYLNNFVAGTGTQININHVAYLMVLINL